MDACFLVLRADFSVLSKHETRADAETKAEKMCTTTGQKFYMAEVLAEVSVPRFPTQWRKFSQAPAEQED